MRIHIYCNKTDKGKRYLEKIMKDIPKEDIVKYRVNVCETSLELTDGTIYRVILATDSADEIVRALREDAEWCDANEYEVPLCMGDNQRAAADLIEFLQAQFSASQRRERDARNELCQRCGRYHEAHKGACDGCRWKEN